MAEQSSTAHNASSSDWLARLRSAGFEVRDQGGRFLVARNGCAAVLENAGGSPRYGVTPGLVRGQQIAHLLDAGFQKFWQMDGARFPARAEELRALHEFEEGLRAALGVTTLYNQALGTVSAKYVYDRVEGREPGQRHESFD